MTRQRSGGTRQSSSQYLIPSTAAEIGRLLRRARAQQGLDLLDVHDRIERPITQLEALEAGDLAGLPDQAFAVSTLRRYASLLGLDGDDLALRLQEAWATPPPKPLRWPRHRNGGGAGVVTEVTSQPEHLPAFTQTGQVPGMGSSGAGTVATDDATSLHATPSGAAPDSGRAVVRARRHKRAVRLLRVATWCTAFLLLVVVAGMVIQHSHPRWLVDWHVTQVAQPGSGAAGPSGAAPGGPSAHPPNPVQLSSSTDVAETYTVNTSQFTVAIATSALCWVEVNNPSSSSTGTQGFLERGQVERYAANGSLTLKVGSSAALIGVTIHGKNVFTTDPKAAPFTYTFVGSGAAASTTS